MKEMCIVFFNLKVVKNKARKDKGNNTMHALHYTITTKDISEDCLIHIKALESDCLLNNMSI